MAIPVVPIALTALRYGGVALIAYAATQKPGRAETRQQTEDALDRVDEGFGVSRAKDREQFNIRARWRRVVRAGTKGPGIELDLAALGRLRFRKV